MVLTPKRHRASLGKVRRRRADTAELMYVYGILESSDPACRLLDDRLLPGIDPNGQVMAIESAGLVAAVSAVSPEQFDEAPLNAMLSAVSQLSAYAVRHESVVRALFAEARAIVPLGFGTVYRGQRGIRAMLKQRAAEFRRLLSDVADCEEHGLKTFADPARLAAAVDDGSERLRELHAAIRSSTPGRAFLLRRQREAILASETSQFVHQAVMAAVDELGAASHAVHHDPISASEGDAHPIVAKVAFLVDRGQRATFQEVLSREQQVASEQGLDLEHNGPWPPYSFVKPATANHNES